MPAAACKGSDLRIWESELLRGETRPDRKARHEQALRICKGCPELEECRAWASSLPLSQLGGVIVAGELRRPHRIYNRNNEETK